jgi:hypothetical protein
MYTKIASALLISAALMTPVAALAAGGNFDSPLCVTSSGSGSAHVVAAGKLDLESDETLRAIWAWVYQPDTNASQVYYKGGLSVGGPKSNYSWIADTQGYVSGTFDTSKKALGGAIMIFTVTGSANKKRYEWWDQFDLTSSGC